ncbi:MAG TPA: hypothetical protein P5308_01370, partial [Syntrophales bacterium]|nr:hypothetical protein [Syntrophales bacterium]
MDYVPHTPADEEAMLQTIGVGSVEDLFADIPERYRLKRLLDLPQPISEQELSALMRELGSENKVPEI